MSEKLATIQTIAQKVRRDPRNVALALRGQEPDAVLATPNRETPLYRLTQALLEAARRNS